MKYLYGPLNSRRLGLSLGINILPYKICNFNCVYCQLGRTQGFTKIRKAYVRPEDILGELKSWLQNNIQEAKNLNCLTISGSGEPTLNIAIGEVIKEIKRTTVVPIAVITNASLLNDSEVRSSLLETDLILPSLDAVNAEIFQQIDRPSPDIKVGDIIAGLAALKKEFRGKIWLEVMVVKGVNDGLSQIRKLKEVIDIVNPDKIQINSPVRTTAEENVLPADKKKLQKIQEVLGDKCEII